MNDQDNKKNMSDDEYSAYLEKMLTGRKKSRQPQNGTAQPTPPADTRHTSPAEKHAAAAGSPVGQAAHPTAKPSPAGEGKHTRAPQPGNMTQPPRKAQPDAPTAPAQNPPSGKASNPHMPVEANRAANSDVDTDQAKTRITDITAIQHESGLKKKRERTKEKHAPGKKKGDNEESKSTVMGVVKALTYIVSVLVVSAFLGVAIILIGNDMYAFVKSDAEVEIVIPEGMNTAELAKLLGDEGLINYPWAFKAYAGLKKYSDEYLPGTYTVSASMNYKEFLRKFKPSTSVKTISITIPEGYTTDEIIDLFVANGIGTREGFIDVINNYPFNYWFIDELGDLSPDRHYRLDGYLFPDTYYLYSNADEVATITKLLDNFKVKFNEQYRTRAYELGYSVDQIVTLASMVERETLRWEDLQYVSSVFHNRLRNSGTYPNLESDATVVYAIEHDTGTRPSTLTAEQLKYDSAYNTYTKQGLPPGAIANPSYDAILYALYPASSNYFYFVADGDGVNHYSSSYSQHQQAIAAINAAKKN